MKCPYILFVVTRDFENKEVNFNFELKLNSNK